MIAIRTSQLPLITGQQESVGQGHMLAQISRMCGRAAAREIIRRCADCPVNCRNLASNQARRFQFGNSQRDVEAILYRIEKTSPMRGFPMKETTLCQAFIM